MNSNTADIARPAHSPGPWIPMQGGCPLDPDADERWTVATAGPRHYCIATIENGQPGDTMETEAHTARLIAAAPDLLDALRELVRVEEAMDAERGPVCGVDTDVYEAALRNAKAAIDKATGGAA